MNETNWFSELHNAVINSRNKYDARRELREYHSRLAVTFTEKLVKGDYTPERFAETMREITEDLNEAFAYVEVQFVER